MKSTKRFHSNRNERKVEEDERNLIFCYFRSTRSFLHVCVFALFFPLFILYPLEEGWDGGTVCQKGDSNENFVAGCGGKGSTKKSFNRF